MRVVGSSPTRVVVMVVWFNREFHLFFFFLLCLFSIAH